MDTDLTGGSPLLPAKHFTLESFLTLSPSWQSIKLHCELHNSRLCLVIVRSGGGEKAGEASLWSLAPGCGLWDWEKGPGGGLGSGPGMDFTISKDTERSVS